MRFRVVGATEAPAMNPPCDPLREMVKANASGRDARGCRVDSRSTTSAEGIPDAHAYLHAQSSQPDGPMISHWGLTRMPRARRL